MYQGFAGRMGQQIISAATVQQIKQEMEKTTEQASWIFVSHTAGFSAGLSAGLSLLLDTGAQVSTITELFFRKHLIQERHTRDVSQLIKMSVAQGLEIPNVVYI